MLVAIIAVSAIYKVFSPKDPWRSIGRIVAPWANITVPTRVRIEAIEPGDTQVFQDARLKVSGLVRGIGPDDPVTLYYSTADSQVVRQPIRMRLPEGSYRYSAELPDTSSGLSQDSTYYITAGDAISPAYQIHVATSPTITVERVDYKYPAYTELSRARSSGKAICRPSRGPRSRCTPGRATTSRRRASISSVTASSICRCRFAAAKPRSSFR